MSNNFLRAILKPILSRRVIQPIFEKAHLFALAAMNFGIGEVDESGESFVAGYVRRRLQNNPSPP